MTSPLFLDSRNSFIASSVNASNATALLELKRQGRSGAERKPTSPVNHGATVHIEHRLPPRRLGVFFVKVEFIAVADPGVVDHDLQTRSVS